MHQNSSRPLRGIPRSRAYWELKAEQTVNRVFAPERTIDLPADDPQISDAAADLPAAAPPASAPRPAASPLPEEEPAAAASSPKQSDGSAAPSRAGWREQPLLLLTVLGGACLLSAGSSVLYLNQWNQVQRNLSQERNLLLVERLRNLGPATPQAPTPVEAPALPAPAATTAMPPQPASSSTSEPPPPPPDEPWIEDLERLPGGGDAGRAATPLRVPLRSSLARTAPVATVPRLSRATPPPPSTVPLPQLVGVVGAPGRAGSAIFQTGGSSTNVSVGETIAGTPWRLRAADGDTVLIERPGELRRLSIGNGY